MKLKNSFTVGTKFLSLRLKLAQFKRMSASCVFYEINFLGESGSTFSHMAVVEREVSLGSDEASPVQNLISAQVKMFAAYLKGKRKLAKPRRFAQ